LIAIETNIKEEILESWAKRTMRSM